jgi:hypothetical protein
MTPAVGSYIWQKLCSAIYRLQQRTATTDAEEPKAEDPNAPKTPPDVKLRTICGLAFTELTFDELSFVQRSAMLVTSRLEGNDTPMPVMQDSGRWDSTCGLEDDPFLVTKLTVEALVFNLLGFLA